MKTLLVISLAKRGGGAAFTSLISTQLSNLNPTYFIAGDSEISGELNGTTKTLAVPHKVITRSWFKFFFESLWIFAKSIKPNSVVLFVMPHPLDLFFYVICKCRKATIVTIIHDATPHPGEHWPTAKALRLRSKLANHVIFLSKFVESQMKLPNSKLRTVCNFPLHQKKLEQPEKYILFTGRMKKYQGLNLILDSWKLASSRLPDYRLLIAGELEASHLVDEKIEVISEWLTPTRMEGLIARCSVLALPYIEASQSGIFVQGASYGVPIVATPVGGLPEQSIHYPGAILSQSLDPINFADAIVKATSLVRGSVMLPSGPDIGEVLASNYFV